MTCYQFGVFAALFGFFFGIWVSNTILTVKLKHAYKCYTEELYDQYSKAIDKLKEKYETQK